MAGKTPPHDLWATGVLNGRRAQTVEAEDGFVIGIVDGKKSLGAAQFVALAGIQAQEFVQSFFSAVEGISVVSLRDGLFVPGVGFIGVWVGPWPLPAVFDSARADFRAAQARAGCLCRRAGGARPLR